MNGRGGQRLGPKADESEQSIGPDRGGLRLRSVLPNAITAAALCSGLTGIRFAISGEWREAVIAIILAGVLDGMDGRIARLLKAQSRFGAELDSLADSLSFGMAPAIILYLWSLQALPNFGWLASLAFAVACALRLARFNAQIDLDHQPHKSAGFLTGIPAPVGAGLAFLPIYLWLAIGWDWARSPLIVGPWMTVIAFLMISNTATLSWMSIRPRRNVRLELILFVGLLFAAVLIQPWWTLAAICAGYIALLPYGWYKYAKIRRQAPVASQAAGSPDGNEPPIA